MSQTPNIRGISQAAQVRQQKIAAQARLANVNIRQLASKKAFLNWCESGFNSLVITKKFRPLEELKTKKKDSDGVTRENADDELIVDPGAADESANYFGQQNPELEKQKLLSLLGLISNADSPDEILNKVFALFPDVTLADEALDFLIENTKGELKEKALEAKKDLNESRPREILAGKNISEVAREFAEEGRRTPTDLREMYRQVTGEARPPRELFDELYDHFSYEQIETIISFLLHALGTDLKAKGPSILPGELHRLIGETKTLQAILGIYRFFENRMDLIHHQFDRYAIFWPTKLTFEFLAKQFVNIINQRYLSPDKILLFSKLLGLDQMTMAQIILLMQMRDALRNTAPKLYRSNKKRQEILDSIIDTLEDLESDEKEEEEE